MPLHPGSIGETFVMLMAICITSFSLGDALEMAWKVIFKPLFKFFQQFFFINSGRPLSISGSRPSQRPSWRANVLTISGDEFPQASGASKNRKIKKAYNFFSKVIWKWFFLRLHFFVTCLLGLLAWFGLLGWLGWHGWLGWLGWLAWLASLA